MNSQICPHCGTQLPTDSPQNVCPQCVIGLGLSSHLETGPHAEGRESSGRFEPPKPHDLSAHFPQLEILDLIGQGGMGAVYKARQRGLDRFVALKILPPEASRDPAFAERFSREARALAKLNHPHIVSVHDSGNAGGLYYLLMEFVDGINLRQAIQTGELGPKEALSIVPQVCDALQYAHEEGIVHRDIKPENVLLDKKGGVKIADFGLARLLGQTGDNFTLTGTHQVMGTPRYMAPEQMEGTHEVDHRADIYSLGVVFYEMLTGELPLGRFAPPSRKVELDVRLDRVVLRTLEKEPELRYQQVSELKHDVESISQLRQLPPHIRRIYGFEYRSETEILGWPLVHIATGIDPKTGKKRIAKGVIAAGDVAVGLLAMGGLAMGGFAVGGCALGLGTFGGLSLGLLVAIGGAAVGVGLSVGGVAIGTVALGGMAIGGLAVGGGAFGVLAYGGNSQNPDTLKALPWAFTVLRWLPAFVVPLTILMGVLMTLVLSMGERLSSGKRRPAKAEPGSRSGNWRKPAWAAAILLVLLVSCAVGSLLLLVYSGLARQSRETSPPVRREMAIEFAPQAEVLEAAAGGLRLSDWFADKLNVSGLLRDRIDRILNDAHRRALVLEAQHAEHSIDKTGQQVTVVAGYADQVEPLEHDLWSQLDNLLNVDQQRIARRNLRIYPRTDRSTSSPTPSRRGILGWGSNGATISIWRVGKWYHWKVEQAGHKAESRGPELLPELQRYWQHAP